MSSPVLPRFEDKFLPEPNSGCWLWLASLTPGGYGKIIGPVAGKLEQAHRISWLLYRGTIPSGLCVLHKCDTRCCVNPDHLFLGTKSDNSRDMRKKGRGSPPEKWGSPSGQLGQDHHRAKLTEAQIKGIRKDARKLRAIAADYGVAESAVSRIRNFQRWRHL